MRHPSCLQGLAAALLGGALACGGGHSDIGGSAGSRAPGAANGQPALALASPGPQVVDEEATLVVPIAVEGATRVEVEGLPPGARYEPHARRIVFRPDFIQGARVHAVTIAATDGARTERATFALEVRDTIAPPPPAVLAETDHGDHRRLRLAQTTDAWLDAAGYRGRSFEARVVVPKAAHAGQRLPVRVYLHGAGGSPYTGGRSGEYAIYPHDPDMTYWWGYAEALPHRAPAAGDRVPNYTQRRVLHLLEWVLRTYPGADPERVYVTGGSMGGAGAKTLGLLYARHFAWVEASVGQAIPANHRPARLSQLSGLWGSPGLGLLCDRGLPVWERMDLTRALLEEGEARAQFLSVKHGKDDPTIHFGAVLHPSPRTGFSFYRALAAARVGHVAVWDEGGHGSADPVLGARWWDRGWHPIFDGVAFLRRDLAFPAFTLASHDGDPGDGLGNGRRSWSADRGYAGDPAVPGDTGWRGEVAGAMNRHLRWDARAIIDLPERLSLPLRVEVGPGGAPPLVGYPSTGDLFQGPLPVVVDVTVRRTQRFRPAPGALVRFAFGAYRGAAHAGPDGEVTVPRVPLTEAWTELELEGP